ncbi:MAG: metallophosphoesterase family protein [bacterium]|nr:metallophosphoesterase family protein [bacterium]
MATDGDGKQLGDSGVANTNSLAVISDVHGNRWALQAVLEDIRRRGILEIVNLGDVLYGPLDPRGTAELLMPLGLPTVCGNEDRLVIDGAAEPQATLRYVRNQLRPRHLAWLSGFPATAVVHGSIFLCHAAPTSDTRYLLWDVLASGAVRRQPAAVAAELAGVNTEVVGCGHDHVPRFLVTPGAGTVVVNPGSVGLPAYCDDQPYPHAMETAAPHARYAVLSKQAAGWQVAQIAVPYDWQAAAAHALANGREDWATWLRTGQSLPTSSSGSGHGG